MYGCLMALMLFFKKKRFSLFLMINFFKDLFILLALLHCLLSLQLSKFSGAKRYTQVLLEFLNPSAYNALDIILPVFSSASNSSASNSFKILIHTAPPKQKQSSLNDQKHTSPAFKDIIYLSQ